VKNGPKAREAGNREVWSNCFLHTVQGLLKIRPRGRQEFTAVFGALNANRLAALILFRDSFLL
jgi:hypothetical protein